MQFLFNGPFYTLIITATDREIHTPRHIAISQTNNTLSTIVDLEATCQQSLVEKPPKPSSANTVSINSRESYLEVMKKDETVDSGWRNNFKISEQLKKYREAFL